DGCGHTVLGPESGTLASINYPQTSPNSTVCEWEIRVKPGQRVQLKFGDFDIDDSDSCHSSYLRVHNGIGPTRTEIGKYCGFGFQMAGLIKSRSNEVTVQFMSGTHTSGRGFLASYSTTDKSGIYQSLLSQSGPGLVVSDLKFHSECCAYLRLFIYKVALRFSSSLFQSSSLCMAGVHAGVVSNTLGGQINVVISKGIPYYEGSLANNVTSKAGPLSTSLFTFKTSGCYGTLGMESGVIPDSQITASSILEWSDQAGQVNIWKPENARLKRPGPPWAAFISDEQQWLQIDLNKEKRITGIITTGSTLPEHYYYVSAYRILYSDDAQKWMVYREPGVDKDKIFQGNTEYYQEVRNNFIPPIIARFFRINPLKWHQKIAMKVELLGCQFSIGRAPKFTLPPPPLNNDDDKNDDFSDDFIHSVKTSLETDKTTFTPEIKNTTVTPSVTKDVALAAVLVPVLVMVFTTLILILVCAWHWRNRKKKTEGTYDLPYWDRAGWWKGMKQFLPTKSADHDETPVRYSSSEISRLRPREVPAMLQTESAEYAQPLVGGMVGTLHQRSTFKPEEGKEASYADLDPYNSPVQEVYHAYAEPLPITGPEYATPIIMDMSGHAGAPLGVSPISTFKAAGNQAAPPAGPYSSPSAGTESPSSARALYDTPKGQPGPGAAAEPLYQVPQGLPHPAGGNEQP
ncbi:DCBD2 protein, partial [Nothocercus julius]|nr:DCBD2 protein [Nothocercus julius]